MTTVTHIPYSPALPSYDFYFLKMKLWLILTPLRDIDKRGIEHAISSELSRVLPEIGKFLESLSTRPKWHWNLRCRWKGDSEILDVWKVFSL